MSKTERESRLQAELAALTSLQATSSIFRFDAAGDSPDRYYVTFHGRGVTRDTSPAATVEIINVHRCEIRLPLVFPDLSPDVRWLTPIFHPNVSFSGFIALSDIGLAWNRAIGLDEVCNRLWDVARAAFVDYEQATNLEAKNWFRQQTELPLPTDSRPLRDLAANDGIDVIRYEHCSAPPLKAVACGEPDLFYINENTPTPELPTVPRGARSPEVDVLYIGDE